jgi:hypothetical protein
MIALQETLCIPAMLISGAKLQQCRVKAIILVKQFSYIAMQPYLPAGHLPFRSEWT